MKKMFNLGDRVMVPGDVNGDLMGEFAKVIGINKDGTINLEWYGGGYAYNRNPKDYAKAEHIMVPYKGLLLELRTGAWDDIMNSCFYVTIDRVHDFCICVETGTNVMFARNDYENEEIQ